MKRVLAASLVIALLPFASLHATPFYFSKSTFDAAVATVLVEDFESTGAPVETAIAGFSHNGLTVVGLAGVPFHNVYILAAGETGLAAGVPQPTSSQILSANGDEDILITFDVPHSAVGFDVYLNGLGPAEVQYYNDDTLLDSYSFPGTENDQTYLGYTGSAAITSFRFTSSVGASINTAIDNISVSVPEPAALIMFALGCLGLAIYRRQIRRCRPT